MRLPVRGDNVTLSFDSRPLQGILPRAFLMKPAYLLSEYPTLGHTYLQREIRQLRALGWDIQTISIRRPSNSDGGSLEEQARRLGIAEQVRFAGWKTQRELRELYLASDVGVLSRFAEGVPVVPMEVMPTGVPYVAPALMANPN